MENMSTNYDNSLVVFSNKPTMVNKSVFVDTNYLNQLSTKDIESMTENPRYVNKINTPHKKQMLKLFDAFRKRKIDLIMSDMVKNELIGQIKSTVFENYTKYLITIDNNDNMDIFFTVAAAINACIHETGKNGDVKDTYSYLLAIAGNIRYFATQDRDILPVYDYLNNKIVKQNRDGKIEEINKIKKQIKLLAKGPKALRAEKMVDCLFLNTLPTFTLPISLFETDEKIYCIFERSEVILWMYRSLKSIENTEYLLKIDKWDYGVIDKCVQRVQKLAKQVNCISGVDIDENNFQLYLFKNSAQWQKKVDDKKLTKKLNAQLVLLQKTMAVENYGYISEDEIDKKESEKSFDVKCDTCGNVFEIITVYEGPVESHERAMGAERRHKWTDEVECPKCEEYAGIEYFIWEYPEGSREYTNVQCNNCEVTPKIPVYDPTLRTSDEF
ncbi:MAG: hypothetical protein LBE76_09525 [Nitrososphaerota archaeon]|jgi:predicted nucleic acid-binding protein|nr:hypothetical protein [Nitrososphaerota archaeon]